MIYDYHRKIKMAVSSGNMRNLMLNCFHVQAPTENELLRYALDGEPLPVLVEEHIAKCSSCRQHLEGVLALNSALLHKFYRSHCPDTNALSIYSIGCAPLNESLDIFYHLKLCPLCSKEVQDMRVVLGEEI
jgi:hypothetical protein